MRFSSARPKLVDRPNWRLPPAAVVAVLCTACGGRTSPAVTPTQASAPAYATASPGSYIKHIVVIVQENRGFESLFAGWQGADALTYGYLHTGKRVTLHAMTYADDCVRVHYSQYCDMGHLWQQALRSFTPKLPDLASKRGITFGYPSKKRPSSDGLFSVAFLRPEIRREDL